MSGPQRLLVGVLVAVPLATIAALVVAVLMIMPVSSEISTDAPTPVQVAAPVINLPDEIALDTSAAIARTITGWYRHRYRGPQCGRGHPERRDCRR